MQVLTAREPSRRAFAKLKRQLEGASVQYERRAGWQGGNRYLDIHWNAECEFWSHLNDTMAKGRYWCCFGTKLGSENESHSIVVELNPPKSGVDRRTAGLFLTHDRHVFVGHSGRIGGGRKGIGKRTFLNWYDGPLTEVDWLDGRRDSVIVIGRLGSEELPSQIARFVDRVAAFKSGARLPTTGAGNSGGSDVFFTPEFRGKVTYKGRQTIDARFSHGHVVDALAKLVGKRVRFGNDRNRDLFCVTKTGAVRALFEVKTGLTTSEVYAGVGQLMVHSAAHGDSVRRFLVLPAEPKDKLQAALKRLGIGVLKYDLERGRVRFHRAADVLRWLK
jgi:hypothetical protein